MTAKIKTGDTVKIIAGSFKGETAKVTKVLPAENKAILDKFCDKERHLSRRAAATNGGATTKTVFAGIDLSNLKFVERKEEKAKKATKKEGK
ncbi:KOW motif-containing protein [Candidatus Saccharibacteria bacterium]|nr:KOW motif-containing protein [Candidatus Saccharibacteria bacterium]